MILATHALTGAVIGKNIDSFWLIIPATLTMHFVLDSLRHGDYVESLTKKVTLKNTGWKVALDALIGMSIVFYAIFWNKFDFTKTAHILAGSFFSVFPDFLTLLYWKFKFKFLKKICRFHAWVHKYPNHSEERKWNLRNATNDILLSLLAIFLLFI